jgi:hypothetical protein
VQAVNFQTATASSIESSSSFISFLLSHMRVGVRRARLLENEILATGVSLKAGLLDPDNAIAHLSDVGALPLCGLSS